MPTCETPSPGTGGPGKASGRRLVTPPSPTQESRSECTGGREAGDSGEPLMHPRGGLRALQDLPVAPSPGSARPAETSGPSAP